MPIFLWAFFLLLLAYPIMRRQLFDIDTLAEIVQETKLSTLGTFAACLLHEIRSPLFVARWHIESFVGSIKQEAFSQTAPDERQTRLIERLQKVSLQIDRVSEIAQRFLEFAKPGVGVRKPEEVSFADVVDTVLSLVGHGLEVDKIEICKTVNPETAFLADRRDLEEILINLITNAYQAMKGGGVLRIADERNDGIIQVKISDTGGGIPHDQIKKIFDPFFSSKKEKGIGLGLYVVKKLIEQNKGKIKVTSETGKGTTFLLEFPAPVRGVEPGPYAKNFVG